VEGPDYQIVLKELEPLDSTTKRDTGAEPLIKEARASLKSSTPIDGLRTIGAQQAELAIAKERTHPTQERIPDAMLAYLKQAQIKRMLGSMYLKVQLV